MTLTDFLLKIGIKLSTYNIDLQEEDFELWRVIDSDIMEFEAAARNGDIIIYISAKK